MRIAVATDVGGGTSYSMLRTLDEGYKVLQLRGQRLDPLSSFYMMTLGNARALSLEGRIGIAACRGGCATSWCSIPAPRRRWRCGWRRSTVLPNELFLLQTCGDDRAVAETYVAGQGDEVTALD